MRIAIVNWSNRRIGGTGSYLSAVLPYLHRAGHLVALWHEVETPSDYDEIPLPAEAPSWSVNTLGLETALASLRAWNPSLLYAHGLLDPAIERRVLEIAPAVFFAHNYYGTCISGEKTFKAPVVTPCGQKFGLGCLARYYPRRCGGWSPITMLRLYRQQKDRLDLLPRYRAIVTHSTHMQREYISHGLAASRVFNVRYGSNPDSTSAPAADVDSQSDRPLRLLFLGRMDPLKGGSELLLALPRVADRLHRRLHLTFAGDGPRRERWEALADRIREDDPRLQIDFLGWVGRHAVDSLCTQSDLLVLPSLWPEPFALVGLEAARHRLPVAAFDVGGVSDWLSHGKNGFLAPGNPPTVAGLIDAIVACLEDPERLARLREGAGRLSAEFAFDSHVELLLRAFSDALRPAA